MIEIKAALHQWIETCFEGFHHTSPVWIFLSDKVFDSQEETEIMTRFSKFFAGWNAHGHPLQAKVGIWQGRVLMIAADEEENRASGCSIDKLIHQIQDLEASYNCRLLDRTLIGLAVDNELTVWSQTDLKEKIIAGEIGPDAQILLINAATIAAARQKVMSKISHSFLSQYLPERV